MDGTIEKISKKYLKEFKILSWYQLWGHQVEDAQLSPKGFKDTST